jgi:hypothetical protein
MGYGLFDLTLFRPTPCYPSRFEPDQICMVNPWDDPDYQRRAHAQGLIDPRDQAKAAKQPEIPPVEPSTPEVDSDSLRARSSNPGTTGSQKDGLELEEEDEFQDDMFLA